MNKGIFVGLGGSGVKSVARIKYKILTRQYAANPQDIHNDFDFLFLDTDNEDISSMNNKYRAYLNNNDLIEDDEILRLGDTNPFQAYWQSKKAPNKNDHQKRLLEWMDPRAANALRDQPLVHGAGGIRVEGRTAVWYNYHVILSKIDKALNIIQDIKTREEFEKQRPIFWVFSGTCGGTGSSGLLDFLYIFDREFRKRYSTFGDPYLRVILFMPHGFLELFDENIQRLKYMPNAYALFKEIELFLEDRWGQDEVRENNFRHFSAVPVPGDKGTPWPLFQYGILCDTHTEYEFYLNLDDLYESAAEMIYYIHLGEVQGSMLSHFDDLIHDFLRQSKGTWRAFIGMGYRALRNAFSDYLPKYIQFRLKYELFKYGLLGKSMDEEISDKSAQQKWMEDEFKKLVLQPLGISDLPSEESNLKDYLIKQIYPQFYFDDQMFRNKKGKLDSDLVEDMNRLDNFEKEAKNLAQALVQAVKNDFESLSSPFSKEEIKNKIATSLRIRFESLMLIYGLITAKEFFYRLDLRCENFMRDLQQQIATDLQKIQQLDSDIEELKQLCQKKGKEKFPEFYQKLKEYIDLQFELQINRERQEILKWLSAGESGLIDEYERIIGSLKGRIEMESSEYEKKYLVDMVKQFHDTQNNPTTTFIPRIHEFVSSEGWKKDHLFARLYEEEIPVQQPQGEPVRHAEDPQRNREGLQEILYTLFTNPRVMGKGTEISPYYDNKIESIRFFSKILDGSWNEGQLLNEISQLVDGYVQNILMARDTGMGRQISQNILDVYNTYVRTQDSERRRIKEEFSVEGTQVFCPLNFATGGKPAPKFYFVAPIQSLAEELGYIPEDSNQQFLTDQQLNAVYKIKFYLGITSKNYGPYHHYENAYMDLKQNLPQKFYPHIHRILNQADTLQDALEMLSERFQEEDLQFFLKLLFFAKIGQILMDDKFKMQRNLVFGATGGIGPHAPVYSPVKILDLGDKLMLKILKRENVNISNRKISIAEEDLEEVYQDANDLQSCFDEIRPQFPGYRNRIASFEEALKSRMRQNWREVFGKVAEALKTELESLYNATQDEFYADLHNLTDRIKDSFLTMIP